MVREKFTGMFNVGCLLQCIDEKHTLQVPSNSAYTYPGHMYKNGLLYVFWLRLVPGSRSHFLFPNHANKRIIQSNIFNADMPKTHIVHETV